MRLPTLIYFLKAHGLAWWSPARRRASVEAFQAAFTWWDLTIDGRPGPETLKAFRHARTYGHRISPHYALAEFRCGCQGRHHHYRDVRIDRDMVRTLERVRTRVYGGHPLRIVSGWRCEPFNAEVGGIPGSAHTLGLAADIPAHRAPAAFRGLGAHGLGYKSHGLVTHIDRAPWVAPDTRFAE